MAYKELNQKESVCPFCGNDDDFEYGLFQLDGESGYYEVKCEECGETFHEVYNIEFVGNYGYEK